ncbi:MAG: hypothetical protein U0271_04245 [Polyangiaceae bacterium]
MAIRLSRAIIGVGLAASIPLSGCGSTDEKPNSAQATAETSVTPPPSSTTTASATPTTVASTSASAASPWLEDDVVRALAKDCHWDPDNCLASMHKAAATSVDSLSGSPESCNQYFPLACAYVPGQSCAPDECSQTDYNCIPECNNSCDTCAGGCMSKCDSCKSTCKDDACRMQCARGCAECRQDCVKGLDQCSSAHCSQVAEDCFKTRDDQWNASSCPKVCDKVSECVEKCPDPKPEEGYYAKYTSKCADSCMKKLGKGCDKRFDMICKGFPDATVNFFAYHQSRIDKGEIKQ